VTPAAGRMQRYRERQRAGLIRLSIDVDDTAVPEMLASNGYIARDRIDDRDAIGEALGRFLADLSKPTPGVTVSRLRGAISARLAE